MLLARPVVAPAHEVARRDVTFSQVKPASRAEGT